MLNNGKWKGPWKGHGHGTALLGPRASGLRPHTVLGAWCRQSVSGVWCSFCVLVLILALTFSDFFSFELHRPDSPNRLPLPGIPHSHHAFFPTAPHSHPALISSHVSSTQSTHRELLRILGHTPVNL